MSGDRREEPKVILQRACACLYVCIARKHIIQLKLNAQQEQDDVYSKYNITIATMHRNIGITWKFMVS